MQAFFQRNLREDDIRYIGNNILKNFITCNLRCIIYALFPCVRENNLPLTFKNFHSTRK